MDRDLKWFSMPVGEQISNIGSEVERALKYRESAPEKSLSFVNKALELIERSQMDPKNRFRIRELGNCRDELIDFFIGDNIYETSEEQIRAYYNAFL